MNIICSPGMIFCLILGFVGADDLTGCKSPQYLETGAQGTVSCSFRDGFFGVYWYNSKEYVAADAIIQYQEHMKRGEGYDSGEFNVHQNGSLIIHNMTLAHDHYFTAIEMRSVDDYNVYYVRVIATVKPADPYPVIENCAYDRTLCYSKLPRGTELKCSARDARPSITLMWVARTGNGDNNLSSELTTTSNGLLNTSTATTNDPLVYSSGMNLLLCKAYSLPGLLMHNESKIIVESDTIDLNHFRPILRYERMNLRLNLSCSEDEHFFLVWKHKQNTDQIFTETAYGIYWNNDISTFHSKGYNLTNAGILIISELRPEHEGIYACIAGNGIAETIVVYDLMVYVPPDPTYPVVEGCRHDQYCVLEVGRKGFLSCTVIGIRPKVKLTWETFHDSSSNDFVFHNTDTTVTSRNDNTFDVLLTARYDATRVSQKQLTIECKVSGKETVIFPLTTTLDLLFIEDRDTTTVNDTVSKDLHGKQQNLSWIIILVAVIVVIFLVLAVVLIVRGRLLKVNSPQTDVEKDANVPMLSVIESRTKDKNAFITQLKTKYAGMSAAVYPIPYLREKVYSVNDVYVESGLELLLSREKFETLESYQEIVRDPRLTSSPLIVEGEAGYGKSMLTLQFAYDWCHGVEWSPLNQTDIFILLQLRQVGGIKSIYEAIKHCLLPKDTKFSSVDIEGILKESNSVVVIFDGYDEYPDRDNGTETFVVNIINREILQHVEAILTTRSTYLPKVYSPLTKRIRLKGFDDIARELYLRKVLVGDVDEAVEKIKDKLRENPFLEDICQVPLFYVLFAHLSNEYRSVLKFNSVTVFFRHIISCIHSHGINKIKDPCEKEEIKSYEREHHKLDEVAFEGLSGNSQQLIWEKEDIVQKVGQRFYNQYISIGILVEEEVYHIIDDPGKLISEHIQYRQQVRFYHKLFCEWYAAHFLANYAARPEVRLDPRYDGDEIFSLIDEAGLTGSNQNITNCKGQEIVLDNLDPTDVHYLYRFACGLNSIAAEKIYQYVTSKNGGDRYAILCLLEQTGKLENIRPTIEKLCAGIVTFDVKQSKLLHRSTSQILDIASIQEIPIAHLWLCNCFEKVTDSERSLCLTSGVKIRQLHSLTALDIREYDREMTDQETIGIIRYCCQSRNFITLKFKYCLMPRKIFIKQVNAKTGSKETVLWDNGFESCFSLNMKSGLWQYIDGTRPMTEEEYEEEAEAYRRS